MSDGLDLGNLLGTVIVGGVIVKTVDTLYTKKKEEDKEEHKEKTKQKKLNCHAEQFKGNSGFKSPF